MKRMPKHRLVVIAVLSCLLFLTPAGARETILGMVGLGALQDTTGQNRAATDRDSSPTFREVPGEKNFNKPMRFAFPMI